jgi:hypothetical protein
VLAAAFQRGITRAPALLEKDVWVVWALKALFDAPFGEHLVFKGGTSLSKAYKVIERFSEDVDLTYDVRAFGDERANRLETLTGAEAKRLSRAVRERLLPRLVGEEIAPFLRRRIVEEGLIAEVQADEEGAGDVLFLAYETAADYPDYVRPRVKLEFGARATGEPAAPVTVSCDLAPAFADLIFPTASPRVMAAERAFWEKATAAHVFCLKHRFAGATGFARHWHDLIRLEAAGYAGQTPDNPGLANTVARHKTLFFPEKGADGAAVDYMAAVQGGLRLAPAGEARSRLAADYVEMVAAGYLPDEAESFEELMAKVSSLEDRLNAKARPS